MEDGRLNQLVMYCGIDCSWCGQIIFSNYKSQGNVGLATLRMKAGEDTLLPLLPFCVFLEGFWHFHHIAWCIGSLFLHFHWLNPHFCTGLVDVIYIIWESNDVHAVGPESDGMQVLLQRKRDNMPCSLIVSMNLFYELFEQGLYKQTQPVHVNIGDFSCG